VLPVVELVCTALRKVGFSWQFATREEGTQLDSKVMAATTPTGDTFLIFFHKAAQGPMYCHRAFYAVDFGVKKRDEICHLAAFDAIAQTHEAVLSLVTT